MGFLTWLGIVLFILGIEFDRMGNASFHFDDLIFGIPLPLRYPKFQLKSRFFPFHIVVFGLQNMCTKAIKCCKICKRLDNTKCCKCCGRVGKKCCGRSKLKSKMAPRNNAHVMQSVIKETVEEEAREAFDEDVTGMKKSLKGNSANDTAKEDQSSGAQDTDDVAKEDQSSSAQDADDAAKEEQSNDTQENSNNNATDEKSADNDQTKKSLTKVVPKSDKEDVKRDAAPVDTSKQLFKTQSEKDDVANWGWKEE